MKRVSPDERLRLIALLLLPAFVGHFIQLMGEDRPWTYWAQLRAYYTPGWHSTLPAWMPWAILAALLAAVIHHAARRTRGSLAAIVLCYVAHYLTYPFRIRNHMTFMLTELVMIGLVWWAGAKANRRVVDRYAMHGAALVVCITYTFAALHKVNDRFLSLGPESSAVQGLTTFWIYGDLGSEPPWIAKAVASYGTVVVEALVPWIAWRVHRLRVPAILVLFGFHFPHVAVMDVADYPMIASTFYPALFTRAHFRILVRHLRELHRWNVGGAATGVALQLWFMPWWGSLTVFGLLVMALWGYAAGSMARMLLRSRAPGHGVG